MSECIDLENKFLSTLKYGQWYSTQMNPVLRTTTNTETKDGNDIKITVNKYEYEYVLMTYYLDDNELNHTKKLQGNMLSS